MYKNKFRQCPFKKVKYIQTVRLITQNLTISTRFKYHTSNFHKQVTMLFSISQCIQHFFWNKLNATHFTTLNNHVQHILLTQTVNNLSYIHFVITSVPAS